MKIRVAHLKYRVELSAAINEYGLCDVDGQCIYISVNQSSAKARETLLHEVLHAAFAHTGLDKELEPDEMDEKIIRRLTPTLLDILRSNPRLIRTLLDKED